MCALVDVYLKYDETCRYSDTLTPQLRLRLRISKRNVNVIYEYFQAYCVQ
jgi:hypothetical protein